MSAVTINAPAGTHLFQDSLPLSGNVATVAPGQTSVITASAPGYTPQSISIQDGDAPVTMTLAAQDTTTSVPFTVTLQPAVPDATASMTGSNGSYAGMCSQDGSACYFTAPPGQYNLTVNDASGTYAPSATVVNVSAANPYAAVQMTAPSDPGNITGIGAQTVPNAAAPYPEDSVPLPTPSGSEAAYSNSAFQGYFTSAQVNVSINGYVIDELNTIQWALQANTIPLYGYASHDADAYGAGRALVQGHLVLNYVTENYLLTLLESIPKPLTAVTGSTISYRPSQAASDQAAAQQLAQLQQRLQAVKALSASQQGGMVNSLQQRINGILARSGPTVVARARAMAAQQQKSQGLYANPVYFPSAFDIRIEIGTAPPITYRLLQKCKLISNEVICDQSGQPILEAYGFIARRAR
jgi:hypothetical protein